MSGSKWHTAAILPPTVPSDPTLYPKYVSAYHLYVKECEFFSRKHKESLIAADVRRVSTKEFVPPKSARVEKGVEKRPAEPAKLVDRPFKPSAIVAEAKKTVKQATTPTAAVEVTPEKKEKKKRSRRSKTARRLKKMNEKLEEAKLLSSLSLERSNIAKNEWTVVSYKKKKAAKPVKKPKAQAKGKGPQKPDPPAPPPSGGGAGGDPPQEPPSGGSGSAPPPTGEELVDRDPPVPERHPAKPLPPPREGGAREPPQRTISKSSSGAQKGLYYVEEGLSRLDRMAMSETKLQSAGLNPAAAAALADREERRRESRLGRGPRSYSSTGMPIIE